MTAPLVSFVVPCFNYARYLPDCVQSILGQQGTDAFEILLIDDCSTDNTADVMRSFTDPRVRTMFNAVNLGHARTVTEGLRASRGRFVARIDPDDRYRPGFLSSTLEKFDRFPSVGAVYGDVSLIDHDGRTTFERADTVHHGDFCGNELVALMERNFICAPSLIARREAWIAALPVPEHLSFNDWYFTLMMARRWDFYYIDRALADYRVHATNHHTRIARDRSEETSIWWLLDRLYAETERDAALEAAKRAKRASIYAAHYVTTGNKYFGFGMYADARRCYLAALKLRPTEGLDAGVARRLAATFMGERVYEALKGVARRVRPPAGAALRDVS